MPSLTVDCPWQVRPTMPSVSGGKTSVMVHGDAGGDVVSSPIQTPDSYAATFESDSRVGSADANAASNGVILLA